MIVMKSAKVMAAKADLFKGEARITLSVYLDSMTADNVRSLSSWAAGNVPVTVTIDKLQLNFDFALSHNGGGSIPVTERAEVDNDG